MCLGVTRVQQTISLHAEPEPMDEPALSETTAAIEPPVGALNVNGIALQ